MKIKPFEEFSPMLASKADFEKYPLKFPLYASPKVDGIRAVISGGGEAISRSDLLIPNEYVQEMLGHSELDGLDGELIVGPPNAKDVFQRTTSGVMSEAGTPPFHFFVFDYFQEDCQTTPFTERFRRMNELVAKMQGIVPQVVILRQQLIHTQEELETFEAQCLGDGFEGVMVRQPDSPYKFGRSTAREGYLLKLKVFHDADAEVIGFEPLVRQDGTVEPMLGALLCRGLTAPFEGIEFKIGSGFTERQRVQIYVNLTGRPQQYLTTAPDGSPFVETLEPQPMGHNGRVCVTFTFFPQGVVDKPRFPIFKGFRDPRDIGRR